MNLKFESNQNHNLNLFPIIATYDKTNNYIDFKTNSNLFDLQKVQETNTTVCLSSKTQASSNSQLSYNFYHKEKIDMLPVIEQGLLTLSSQIQENSNTDSNFKF